jgi:hypothetical protein
MAKIKPMIGIKYNRLEALKEVRMGNRGMIYLFQCDCGNQKELCSSAVRSGHSKSCGCLRSEMTAAKNETHGAVGTPTYETWQGMKARCLNPNTTAYKNYGGRGITLCQEWLSFEQFIADMGERPDGHTLERIDNSKGYNKENCRWATYAEQNRNTRQNKFLTKNGKTMCMRDWAKETGIPYPTIQDRVRRGWLDDRVLERAA